MKDVAIVWFRNDLRVNDNEALSRAISESDHVIPVYIFDERIFFGKTKFGFKKTDYHRASFILESVANLRDNLQRIGLELYIDIGKPEDIIYDLAKTYSTSWVYTNRERTDEEVKVQDALEKHLWTLGQEIVYTRGKMLLYTSDLPFPVMQTPDVFTAFRKEVEKFVPIRKPLAVPQNTDGKLYNKIREWGNIPTLSSLGHEAPKMGESIMKGGETVGLQELQYYLWETNFIANYKETRNELLGRDYSSKFSMYLAHGCLSPKTIYHEVKRYEAERVSNQSTYWLIFELLWRDYFRLVGKKYENKIFQQTGILGDKPNGSNNMELFKLWAEGKTGIPFIDANMLELNRTGFMSNRGRQNVASFLVNDLKVNWLLGAEYFESKLIDYDPCSNYGNWMYIAGVGNDPRENRYFNIVSQAERYDEDGRYVKHWIRQLENLPAPYYHQPDIMGISQQERYNFILGKDYPKAIVSTRKWNSKVS